MKTYLIIAAFLMGTVSLSSCGPGQFVVSTPANVMYTRPGSPGEGYIWIDGDWYWSGGRYTWREGRWDRPRPGRVWHGGSWQHTGRGYKWNRGHWR